VHGAQFQGTHFSSSLFLIILDSPSGQQGFLCFRCSRKHSSSDGGGQWPNYRSAAAVGTTCRAYYGSGHSDNTATSVCFGTAGEVTQPSSRQFVICVVLIHFPRLCMHVRLFPPLCVRVHQFHFRIAEFDFRFPKSEVHFNCTNY